MKLAQMLTDSFSGLVNYVTGTGTAKDKITHARWQFERPQDQQLLALYRSTWIARKLVDIPIADMLREGWRWQADEADITKLEEEERRLGVAQKLKEALTRDAVFGGGALILGDGTSDTAQPLLPESIGLGGLQYLIVAGRGELTVKELVRVPGVEYGKPAMFELLPLQGRALQIHPTRVITFNAMPIPAPLGVLGEQDFWGDSRLAAVLRDIAAAMSGVAGTGRLMEELAITYHKIAGFTEKMAEKGGEEQVRRVISLMNQMKSSVQAVPIDKDDDIEVITASFAGIPEALRSLMQNVSGAGDIPLTRFLGSSPDGMNATGASDTRNYYDRLAGERQADIVPAMDYLDQFLIPSALGRQDDAVRRVWNPLWQLSEVEQVDLDAKKIKIMTDTNTAGIVHDHVVEQVTRTIMIDSPTFQGAEKAFEEADKMPDPEPEDVEEANSLQAGGGQPPERPRLQVVGDSGDLEDWDIEDVKAWMSQPRHPAGSSKGGQWSGGASQSNYGPQMPAQGDRSLSPEKILSRRIGWDDEPDSNGSLLEMPIPIAPKEFSRKAKEEVRAGGGWDAVPRKPIVPEAKDLLASQDVLQYAHTKSLIDNWSDEEATRPSLQPGTIYRTPSGKMLIFDGHHRTIVAASLGKVIAPLIYDGKMEFDDQLTDADLVWNEDLKAWMSQPRHPAGSSKGGQWSGGPSQSNYGPRTPEGWKPPKDAPKSRRSSSSSKKAAGPDREKIRALTEQRDAAAAAVARKEWSQEEVLYKLQGQITSEVAKSPDFPETRNPARILTPQAEVTREMRQELRGWSENGYGYSQGVTVAFKSGSAAGPVERAINNFKASEPFTTYRGSKGDFAEKILAMKPGDTIRENNPISTSYDAGIASNYAGANIDKGVVVAIRVREGDTAAPTYKFADYTKTEKEITLPSGTTYRIVEVDREARTAVAEIIRQPVIRDGKAYMEDSVVTLELDDVKAWMSQPRHPAGSSKGGQWSGGASQSNYGPQMPGGTGASSASGSRERTRAAWASVESTAPDTSGSHVARIAPAIDPTPEDYEFARSYLDDSTPVIVTQLQGFITILEQGFRPAVETNRTTRAYSPAERTEWEQNIFGVSGQHPIYGALDKGGATEERLVNHGYGAVAVRLKPEAMAKATATMGDSLNENIAHSLGTTTPEIARTVSPSRPFKPADIDDAARAVAASKYGKNSETAYPGGKPEYLEIQLWGGVRPEMIESVVFHRKPPAKIVQNRMRQLGITWEDRSMATDGWPMADTQVRVLARNPETGAILVDAGPSEEGYQMATLIMGSKTGPTQALDSFLKFGGWELE